MATLVQAQIVDSTTTNPSSTALTATTIGNKIVVRTASDHSGAANSVTSVAGGGVTTFTGNADVFGSDGTLGHALQCWSGPITSSATTAITLGWSTASNSHVIWIVEEWADLGAFDKVSAFAGGASTAPLSATSGTLTNADSTVFGWGNWRTTGTLATATVGAGYSNFLTAGSSPVGNFMGGAFESKQVAAITATTAGVTLGTSNGWGFAVAAFQNAGVSIASPRPYQGRPSQNVQRSFFW